MPIGSSWSRTGTSSSRAATPSCSPARTGAIAACMVRRPPRALRPQAPRSPEIGIPPAASASEQAAEAVGQSPGFAAGDVERRDIHRPDLAAALRGLDALDEALAVALDRLVLPLPA